MPENEPVALFSIKKPSGIVPEKPETCAESIRAMGGPRETAATNSSNLSPRAMISTSLPRFFTRPAIPNSTAFAYTKGRNPTPCTMPRTAILPCFCMVM